jgi:nucleoid-associated protein YgaU
VGSVAQAVWEFDEAVQAPWRPPLRAVPGGRLAPPAAGVAPVRRVPARSGRVAGGRPGAGRPLPGPGRPGPVSGAGSARPGQARRPAPRRADAPPLRLTRRARRLVAVLALGCGIATCSWLGSLLTGSSADGLRLVGESSVVVEPGDTLWSIAGEVAGSGDVRPLIDRIQDLNGLTGAELVPGQVLRLP